MTSQLNAELGVFALLVESFIGPSLWVALWPCWTTPSSFPDVKLLCRNLLSCSDRSIHAERILVVCLHIREHSDQAGHNGSREVMTDCLWSMTLMTVPQYLMVESELGISAVFPDDQLCVWAVGYHVAYLSSHCWFVELPMPFACLAFVQQTYMYTI